MSECDNDNEKPKPIVGERETHTDKYRKGANPVKPTLAENSDDN